MWEKITIWTNDKGFSITPSDIFLVGPNGVGKTMILSIIKACLFPSINNISMVKWDLIGKVSIQIDAMEKDDCLILSDDYYEIQRKLFKLNLSSSNSSLRESIAKATDEEIDVLESKILKHIKTDSITESKSQSHFLKSLREWLESDSPIARRMKDVFINTQSEENTFFRGLIVSENEIKIDSKLENDIEEYLSLGEKRFISIVSEIGTANDDSWIMIDEPELSLSIPLQRRMKEILELINNDANIKLLLTSHSPDISSINDFENTKVVQWKKV